jgi:sec-independent protein translocase protein TatB
VFDIGFTELLLCLIVALVVIGPEQLPGAVRTIGLWIGRLKRSLRDTREEIERQIGADDIRRQLHNEEIMQNLEQARLQIEQTMRETEAEANRIDLPTAPQVPKVPQVPKAPQYGPPEELPDHAHMNEQKPEEKKPMPALLSADNQSAAIPASQSKSDTGN